MMATKSPSSMAKDMSFSTWTRFCPGVQNIFNSFQKDLDKGEFRDAGYFYGPTQPRTFFIGFKIMN